MDEVYLKLTLLQQLEGRILESTATVTQDTLETDITATVRRTDTGSYSYSYQR
jgi:hypothetical protein